ncbi:hypothetical protein C8R43DRAFT_993368 [Mycena crocata]|nr:hypothetical protein C8R43DRAFT_993368 [Mycena crocata]
MHDDLRLRNLSELPISTRRFATAAANGSWKDLRLLIERAGTTLRPRHIFPIFFANLDPGGIPSGDQLDPTSPSFSPPCILLVVISMQAMTSTRTDLFQNQPLPTICADMWPRVWQWIDFLHTHGEFLSDLRKFPEADIYELYVATILDLQDDPATAAIIDATPGVRSVLAHAWKIFLKPQSSLRERGFHGVCRLMLSLSKASAPENLTALADGASSAGDMDDLAALIVQHIHRVRPGANNPMSQTTVFFLRGLVNILKEPGTHKSPLTPSLIRQGIAKALTTALLTCATHGAAIDGTIGILGDCFALFRRLGVFYDRKSIAEALDAGLLRAVVVCGTNKLAAIHDKAQTFILMFNESLVDHFHLGSFEAALAHPQIRRLSTTESFRASQISGTWFDFVALAEQRIAVLHAYDSGAYAHLKVAACGNTECPRPGLHPQSDFARCIKCYSVLYCSAVCQAAHWRREGGHRASCRTVLPANRFSTRQRSFLRALVHAEYRTARCDVLLHQLRFLHKYPGESFQTVLNYAHGPLEIQVWHLWQDRRRDEDDGASLARITALISRQSCDFVIHPITATLREGLQRIVAEIPQDVELGEIPQGAIVGGWPVLREKVQALLAQERDEVLVTF